MAAEQESVCDDWFVIGTMTETSATDGGITDSYVDGSPKLGSLFNPASVSAYRNQLNLVEKCDALMRTVIGITIQAGDRITVFMRNGIPCNIVYYVITEPVQYRTTQVVSLSVVKP